MCNLYKMSNSAAEVARTFNVVDMTAGANRSDLIYPGQPGLVVVEGEGDGGSEDGKPAQRELRQMIWGFPLVLKSKRTGEPLKPKPVNNAREDKLDSFFWRDSWAKRRYVIPVAAFAEAEGPKGGKTRTWFSLPPTDTEPQPIFACAGVWRATDEWGPVYSMIMTEANETVALSAEAAERLTIEQTEDAWIH